jgi:hypothetical protein
VIIDGEAVYCDEAGVSVFDKLHSQGCDAQVILSAATCWCSDGGRHRLQAP